jgi:asparagine synthase (glutamine-hydrolysing)
MCGIAGIYDASTATNPQVVRDMTAAMVHRGPDGDGFHFDGRVGLGMRRLAIMDVEHGDQPLFDESRDIAVVFNGEIYNQRELRRDLEGRGHSFRSGSDGEVLPHLYEEYGHDFLRHLNGIFAIALWDAREQTLIVARDRFGVKPMYWSASGEGRISFASELKALLEDDSVERVLDIAAIDQFLTYRFFPSPSTPYAGVRKLPPASFLTVSASGHRLGTYWEADHGEVRAPVRDLVERYSEAFETAVVRQMMSDRPIGVMLSGGVDSGAITSVLAKHSSQVRTYTIGFAGGGDADETELAEQTAKRFGTRHESMVVSTDDYLRRLPESYGQIEEPIGTSSALAVNYVSELMRTEVPVGLSGQGADELMGGYWRYVGIALAQSSRPLAPLARAAAGLPLGRLGARFSRGLATVGAEHDVDLFMRAYSVFSSDAKGRLYRPEIARELSGDPAAVVERLRAGVGHRKLLDQMLAVDTRLWLPDELLLIADKMSMAASVELRVPFLDNDLVALAESIPGNLKVRRLRRKYLHKKAMTRWLPDEVVYRKERGWSTPMSDWLRSELRPLLRDVLLGDGGLCRALFDERELETMIDDHRAGRRDLTRQLFCLLGLGLWHSHFGGSVPGGTIAGALT